MTRKSFKDWLPIGNGDSEEAVRHCVELLRDGLISQAQREGFDRVFSVEVHRSQQNREFFPAEEQSPYDEIVVVTVYAGVAG